MLKVIIGIILAIIGTGVTAINAFSTPISLVEALIMTLGIGLIVVYCFLTWDWFKAKFGKDASIALFLIPLITFGAVTIIMNVFLGGMKPPHDKIQIVLGVILIVVPLFLLRDKLFFR